MRRIVRAILGIVLYFISAVLAAGISALLPISWLSAFIQNAIMYFIVIFFTPLIFLKLESRLQKRRDLGTSKHDASVTQ
jgi:membrane protease YdiL (CAAX protease family)